MPLDTTRAPRRVRLNAHTVRDMCDEWLVIKTTGILPPEARAVLEAVGPETGSGRRGPRHRGLGGGRTHMRRSASWRRAAERDIALYIKPAVGNVPLSDVTRVTIDALVQETARHLSADRAQNIGATFCSVMYLAYLIGYIPTRVDAGARPRVKVTTRTDGVIDPSFVPTRKQIRQLIAALRHLSGTRYRADTAKPRAALMMVSMLVLTGMSWDEAAALTWGDLDLEAGQATIQRRLERDGSGIEFDEADVRRVPLPKVLITLLRAWRDDAPRDGRGFFFSAYRSNNRKLAIYISRVARQYLDEPMSFTRTEVLRFYFVTEMLGSGVSPEVLVRQLGYRGEATFRRLYANIEQRRRDRAPTEHAHDLGRRLDMLDAAPAAAPAAFSIPNAGQLIERTIAQLGALAGELSIATAPEVLRGMHGLRDVTALLPTTTIYFLVRGEAVVYIGQSVDIGARLSVHADSGKQYDRVYVLPIPIDELDAVEAVLIHHLRPQYNAQLPPLPDAATSILRRFGLNSLV